MELQFSLYAHDPLNLSVTYFGLNLERPFQYKVEIINKKSKDVLNNVDFIITEMNTEIKCKVSNGDLIDALSKYKTNFEVAESLFKHPDNLMSHENAKKYNDFIIANKYYIYDQLNKNNIPIDKMITLLGIIVISHFAEILKNVYEGMINQAYGKIQKEKKF